MNIFVTGASGFLGKRVVHRLIHEGHSVSALTRSEMGANALEKQGIKPILGSLESIENWGHYLSGIDIVIHMAAIIDSWGKWEDFQRVITEASVKLLAEANHYNVGRFIYISSESVMQDKEPLLDADENTPCPENPSSFYGKSKRLAEKALLEYEGHINRIILRPTFIWGEDSAQMADLIKRATKGKFPWLDKGSASFEHVYVDNVVEAIVKSLNHGKNKGIYLITNDEAMTAKTFFETIFKRVDVPSPTLSLPSRPLYGVARLFENLWLTMKLRGRPPLTRFEIEFLSLPRRYNIQKAKNELKYNPIVTFEKGVTRFVE